jgi:hypothetical protein
MGASLLLIPELLPGSITLDRPLSDELQNRVQNVPTVTRNTCNPEVKFNP